MKSKIVNVNGTDYEIKVQRLADRSLEGTIVLGGIQWASMKVPSDTVYDLKTIKGEEMEDLMLRLLESFAKSGFVVGRA
ncbi:MAG TPA: hypothetical protein VNX46_06555 [Candidatus Acidoferrum sp.]|jgi:hypothetical protein|nr:hypothetical protein [Candidatus Acidoferrum sp.]